MKLKTRIRKLMERKPSVELTDPIEQGFLKAYEEPGWCAVGRYIDATIATGRLCELITWARDGGRMGKLIDGAHAAGWLGYLIDAAQETGRLDTIIDGATQEQQAMICDAAGIEK